MVERLAYSISECAQSIGISRARAYQLAQAGELPIRRINGRIVVPVSALRRSLDGKAGSESQEER